MESGLAVKANALEILEKQLAARAKKYQYGIVAVGSATDAYIHHEDYYRMTEGILRLLLKYRFPVFISTKCTMITRDIELLKEIDKTAILPEDLKDRLQQGLILAVSVSTLDQNVSNILEPGAAPPLQRLALVKRLKQDGFLVGVNAIPVLPFISDTEEGLETIIAAAKEYEADYVLVGGLTLFGNGMADSKTLFYKFLERYDASLVSQYLQLYDQNFYVSFQYQNQLKERSDKLCKKYNIRNTILK